MPMTSTEKQNIRLLIGGKDKNIAPLSFRPRLNWLKQELKGFANAGEQRALQRLQMNSGIKTDSTKKPRPDYDPDPAA